MAERAGREERKTWLAGWDFLTGIRPECQERGHKFGGRWYGVRDWGGEIEQRRCERPYCNINETRWKSDG